MKDYYSLKIAAQAALKAAIAARKLDPSCHIDAMIGIILEDIDELTATDFYNLACICITLARSKGVMSDYPHVRGTA